MNASTLAYIDDLLAMTDDEREKELMKLHRQFARGLYPYDLYYAIIDALETAQNDK